MAAEDKAWLVRVGEAPKGIMAVGTIVSEPYDAPHFDTDKEAAGEICRYVDIEFTRILNVYMETFITEEDLSGITVDNQRWMPQSSGIEIKQLSAAKLESLWNELQKTEKPMNETTPIVAEATNLILYGPPGTGKTHHLNQLKTEYLTHTQLVSREQWLAEQLREMRWFDVVLMTLYALGGAAKVADMADHEWVRQKALAIGRTQHVKQQIWAILQTHADEASETVNYAKRQAAFVFDKKTNSEWQLVNDWKEQCEDLIEFAEKLKCGPQAADNQARYEFVTFHQAYSYEDFVEGIRPVQDEDSGELVYRVVPGVFRRICQRAQQDPANRYAIFIDEINRGNIAKIFGELITLIEQDKRATYAEDGGLDSGMAITLPYSGDSFTVPRNLDIYGTMNTADRSIALLDTALRRRFRFREMMPEPAVVSGSRGDGYIEDGDGGVINLRGLLEAMNRRIRFLLNRDLMLGHAYLTGVRDFNVLKDVLLNQFVPLLQEYFYDDWHRIQLVFRDVDEGNQALKPQIIRHETQSEVDVLGFDHDDYEDLMDYRVAGFEEISPTAVRKIYETAG